MAADGIPEALRTFRRKLDLSQAALADRLGLKRGAYASYELGIAKLPAHVRAELERMGFEEVGPPRIAAAQLLVPIPFIGGVSAGTKAEWTDPMASEALEEVPPEMAGRRRFCCRVGSDSCYDLLWPGDLAVFEADDTPKIGLVVLFRSHDSLLTLKQLKHDGRDFVLHPLNPKYEDETATGSSVGYLVGIVREIGSRRVTVYDRHGIHP